MDSLFIAFPLSKAIKSQLERLCFGLPHVQWTEHAHFYLNFFPIGQVDGAVQLDIQEILSDIHFTPFSLALKGLGCFRAKKATSGVIWAGVSASDELAELIKHVTAQLAPVLPNFKITVPHVILGRFAHVDEKRLFDYFESNALFETQPFFNDSFALINSHTTSDNRILFHELASFKLTPPINKLRIID
jgi:RNA 2',3'-cyclic 3'-phosphodiesterase